MLAIPVVGASLETAPLLAYSRKVQDYSAELEMLDFVFMGAERFEAPREWRLGGDIGEAKRGILAPQLVRRTEIYTAWVKEGYIWGGLF